ncbi:MAG: hypothetical protein K6E47_02810 [Lachnospiraceae bacterium]|nr:hypothetical protein [Lachnospiraceae bacterium]
MKNNIRIISRIIIVLLLTVIVFGLITFVIHRIKTAKEINMLKDKGYYNPVSVGEYSLNVAKFGNENSGHTIVSLAGLGNGDYSVTQRHMSAALEEDYLVVFVDRAGYGLSEDTNNDMTLEYIVEDYRKALKNSGLDAPYIIMAQSESGLYANYWSYSYPEEIEVLVYIDVSDLSEKSNEYSEEEQYLADALNHMTMDSASKASEKSLLQINTQKAEQNIIKNDIPKLYIYSNTSSKTIDNIYSYTEKLGNCDVINAPGDNIINQQKSEEYGHIIKEFIDKNKRKLSILSINGAKIIENFDIIIQNNICIPKSLDEYIEDLKKSNTAIALGHIENVTTVSYEVFDPTYYYTLSDKVTWYISVFDLYIHDSIQNIDDERVVKVLTASRFYKDMYLETYFYGTYGDSFHEGDNNLVLLRKIDDDDRWKIGYSENIINLAEYADYYLDSCYNTDGIKYRYAYWDIIIEDLKGD